jgi:hypothetical protein
MKTWFPRIRRRLSFANVMSATAVFIAMGGTSYAAVHLSHNSVGAWQIRTGAVGKSEIRGGAVSRSEIRHNGVDRSEINTNAVGPSEVRRDAINTDEIADGGLEAKDLSAAAQTALETANGVSFRTAATATGAAAGGNAKAISHAASSGIYTVDFGQDVSACMYSATIGAVKTSGGISDPPATALAATASPSTDVNKIVVKTLDADGNVLDAPFHLLVAC